MRNVILIFLVLQLTLATTYGQRKSDFLYNKFQPGDAVRIEIIEVLESQGSRGAMSYNINDDYSIARDGTILMPLIGRIKVEGHTPESLVELLTQKYSPYFKEPFITATPLIRITLMGNFIQPGSYRIDPNASLWELIEMAKGPGEDCDLNSLRVERGGKVVIADLLASFEKGHSLSEIGVSSGDQIIARSRRHIGLREIFDYSRFAITLILLYLQIKNLSD